MPLEINFDKVDTLPLDLAGITPDKLQTLTTAEVEHLTVRLGRVALSLADVSRLKGSPADGRLRLSGALSHASHVGAAMKSGELDVDGSVGHFAGVKMTGGTLRIEGNAGNSTGAEMRGGVVRILGDVGNRAGANLPGSKRGMNGGCLLVQGNAGEELGMRMRRGLIAVAGCAKGFVGRQMLAGTILVADTCGSHAGADMSRGTLCLLRGFGTKLLDTFRPGCQGRFPVLRLLERQLIHLEFSPPESISAREFQIFHGDSLQSGRGEVFLPVA